MNQTVNFSEIKNPYSYNEFKQLVTDYAEKGQTTGVEQLTERIEATKINAQRMKRIDKTLVINDSLQKIMRNNNQKMTWIILVESWCGDGAQSIPILAKIAECAPNIKLEILLRDENLGIMDSYLTNGSRSIPKLIMFNSETKKEIGTWGPRPVKIQEMIKEYKEQFPESSHDEFVKNLHLWYAKDKGESLHMDFVNLFTQWSTFG